MLSPVKGLWVRCLGAMVAPGDVRCGEIFISTEPWVSVEDVATHLGVAKDSVYRWIERTEAFTAEQRREMSLHVSEQVVRE